MWLRNLVLCFSIGVVLSQTVTNDTQTKKNNDFNKVISDMREVNYINNNSSEISVQLVQPENAHTNNEKSKIITQREVIHQENPKSETQFNDVRLFLPPDITLILEGMSNIQDEMCKEHVLLIIQALNNREKWAMQMLDSSAKFPSGVLMGSYYQMGNYDECISVKLNERDTNVPLIKGQYCLAEVHSNNIMDEAFQKNKHRSEENSTLYWAICVPHSCKPKEVSLILDFILNGVIGSSKAVTVKVEKEMCHYSQNVAYTPQEMTYAYVIISLVSLICIATIYHIVIYYHRKNNKIPSGVLSEVIMSFSIVHNVKKMMSVRQSDLNLNCICGIKFLSMVLIICSHSLLFLISGPVTNDEFLKEALQKVENSIFLNNPLLVDTYLLISGFLLCRLVFLELEKRKGRVNFLVLYIARYVRLTPVYLIIIGFYSTWLVRLDDGPLWDSKITKEQDRCINSWWTNILYINNYVKVDQMCMFQSWYLAVDTQLFMIAPLIVYPLWRWRKIGELILGTSLVLSVFIPSIITYINKLDPTFMLFVPEIRNIFMNYYFINSYIKTHMRANSYCLGLFFGYLVHKLQSSNYKFPRITLVVGWIFSGLFMISSIFSVMIFYNPIYEYNAIEAAAYSVLHRVVWCVGVGWILVACITGNGGPVQKFLCWKPFIPLSRITYCAYLVNGIIELHSFATVRQARYMSVYHLACDCLAHLILTFTFAFLLCILFESPITGCEKLILRREKKLNQNQQTNDA